MYPRLLPGLHALQRDDTTVQLGIHGPRAITIRDKGGTAERILRYCDGRHSVADIAIRARVAESSVKDLVSLLRDRKLLMPRINRAVALVNSHNPVTTAINGLLNSEGIPTTTLPEKLFLREIRRKSPPLVVLPHPLLMPTELIALSLTIPYISIDLHARTGVIGPLVIPGKTPCLQCIYLHRCDRDRAWPLLTLQIGRNRQSQPRRSEPIATATAAIAAAQACQYLFTGTCGIISTSLAIDEYGGMIRKRTWQPHPRCGCLPT